MKRYDLITFGDSHIGPIMHVHDRMPTEFSAAFLLNGAFCWVDNGMIIYSFTSKSRIGDVEFNPIMSMYFERYKIFDRWHGEWAKDDFNLVFITGFVESHIVSWKWEWQGYALTGDPQRDGDQVISIDLLRDFIESRLMPYFDGLALLCERGFQVFQVAGPPPHRNVPGLALAPEARLVVYNTIVSLYEEQAEKLGFRFFRSDYLAAEDGFLLPEFEDDGVHVNPNGGIAILRYLSEQLEGLRFAGESATAGHWPPRDFVGEGWHENEAWGCWSSQERAQVVFRVDKVRRVGGLVLSLISPVSDVIPTQIARFVLNGRHLGSVVTALLKPNGSFEVDGSLFAEGRNVLEIVCDKMIQPSEHDPQSRDHRPLGIGLTGLTFRCAQGGDRLSRVARANGADPCGNA